MQDQEVIELLETLVQIESHTSVHNIRQFLTDNVENAYVHEDSGCVVASKGSESGNPHVFLNSHMDVVTPPLPYERDEGIIRGRGSCDAKGSLVPLIAAFTRADPTEGRITLVISPDEETYSEGLFDYLSSEGQSGDMAVVGEPTGLRVCNGARGSLKYILDIKGQAAHAGMSETGTSSISCAAEAIQRLENLDQITDKNLGKTSQTVGWIEGGEVGELMSQVPRKVSLFLNRWSVPPEVPEDFRTQIEEELSDLDCEVTVRYPYMPNRFLEAHYVDSDEEVIQRMHAAVEKVTEQSPPIQPFDVAAESSFFARFMPVAIFGPGLTSDESGPIAHSDREFIRTEEVIDAANVLTEFLKSTI